MILVQCDNEASVIFLNSGRARDPVLQSYLRELEFIAARFEFEIRAVHIKGVSNRVPDALSRWSLGPEHEQTFWSLLKTKNVSSARELYVYEGLFELSNDW